MGDGLGTPFCGTCGQAMKPLLLTYFCPNECDRIPQAPMEDVETKRLCIHCGSDDVDPWNISWHVGHRVFYCHGCQNVWQVP